MEYKFLEQRIAKYYIDLLAPFMPAPEICAESQKEFHSFVSGFLGRIYEQPETFFTKLHEDDAHPNRFNCASYGKPDLKRNMKIAYEKIGELFAMLRKIGREGTIQEIGISIPFLPGRKEQKQLAFLGLDLAQGMVSHAQYPRMVTAWQYLALKPDALSLERCWFDDHAPYMEETFARFYNRDAYQALLGWLRDHGYKRYVGGKDYPGMGSSAIMDFAKCSIPDDKPMGYAIHGDKFHYGFTFEYRYEPRIPQHSELRILKYKDILEGFAAMPALARGLIMEKAKRCDKCGYCTQTDKTGTRPRATVTLQDGTCLCTYYPGFNFVFTELDIQRVAEITAFLEGMEEHI